MRVVVISGYFNPIHKGHIDSKKLCDYLICIVNNDKQVEIKGSKPFQDENERRMIVSNIKGVDSAVISIDEDATVCQSLRAEYLKHRDDYFFLDMVFCNGGDRKEGGVPEDILTDEIGIRMIYNVGGDKTQSSSELLKDY